MMHTTVKRTLAWLLALCMVLSLMPVTALGAELEIAPGWSVVNQDEDLTINSASSITIQTRIGDLAKGYAEPSNYWLMDAPEGDFTLTMKVSGGLYAHAQKVGLMVFHNATTVASVARRYHSSGGGKGAGNYFGMFQNLNGSWGETFYADENVDDDAWLKLERSGDTFNGWYSYDGDTWVSVGSLTNATVGGSADMKIGLYALNGSKNDSVAVTAEDFTVNGTAVPFAYDPDAVVMVDVLKTGDGWTVHNEDGNCVIESETAISMPTGSGDFASGKVEPSNYWLMDAPDGDFTITAKVTGTLSVASQTVGIMAFHDKTTISAVCRRYHTGYSYTGTKNVFSTFQHYGGSWYEKGVADPNPGDTAWLKLVKSGNVFSGFYSYDGETWLSAGDDLTNETVGGSDQLQIGVYATRGSGKTAATVTIEEFTCDGTLYPFGKTVQEPVTVESVTADREKLGLVPGDQVRVSAAVEPAIAQTMLRWESSDESVATIEDGVITAQGVGSAVITARAGEASAEIQVEVLEDVTRLLSESQWESISVGYGNPGVNACVSGHSYTVVLEDGTEGTFDTCVAAHAASEVVYDISEQGALYFSAYIALHNQNDGRGNAGFDVKVQLADGSTQVLYTVESMTETTPAKYINVAIPENAVKLILIGDIGTDSRNSCDHTIWGEGRLILDPAVQGNLSSVSLQAPSYLAADGIGQAVVTGKLVSGENADLSEAVVEYVSSDDTVLSVDENGRLTGTGDGTAELTATVTLGGITKSASVQILVGDDESSIWSVTSPDGALRTVVMLADGKAQYMVLKDGLAVAERSDLGIVTGAGDFTSGLTFVGCGETTEVRDSFDLTGAKVSHVEAVGNEMTVHFEKDGVGFAVTVRMYNDAVALRYAIGGEGELTVSSEYTTLQIPADATVYAMPYARDNQSQEQELTPAALTGTYSEPMLYETADGTWVLISEAGLTGNYCGTYLRGDGTGSVRFHFSKEQSGDVVTSLPFASPWRMLVIGSAADIANNTVAETLSPAAEGDFSWVEPGVTAWTWLNGDSTRDYNTYISYVDACAELGWKYLLLDDGWQPAAGEYYDWFADLSAYAKEKGVKLLVWAESWDLADAETRRAVFAEWVEMGISGAKIDHFLSSSQGTLQTQQAMMADAAEFKLVLNFHGSAKPAGERRTWPNFLTSEGVYGAECSVSRLCAFNNCLIPFTRGAVGAVDYTPLFSHNRKNLSFSLAQMAAMAVVYESGIPCLADKPATYLNSPAALFFRDMPASWDESVMLEADPGELVVTARRSGEDWYVGGMCNAAHTQELSLSFLGEGEYYAVVCTDGTTIKEITAENLVVTADTTLTIPMLASGGFVLRIMREDPSADEVRLDKSEMTLESYTTGNLTASVLKDGEEVGGIVSWTSSDETVATVEGGKVLAREPGTAIITASTARFGEGTVTAECVVTVAEGRYVPADGWVVVNRDQDLTINSETSISINTRIGDLATGYIDPANYWLMDAPEGDFTLTVKVSGGLYAHAQKIGLMAFHDNITIASVARRYHNGGGGNKFGMFQRYGTTWGETFHDDPDVQADAWLKLERSGNTFSGWYSFDGETWVSVGTLENDLVGQSEQMQIGVYAINGSKHDSVLATIQDFTLNGELVPFAKLTATGSLEAVLAAQAAAEAAKTAAEKAQAAAEAAQAQTAVDKTAAEAAKNAAETAEKLAEDAKAAAEAAKQAADAQNAAAAEQAKTAAEAAAAAAEAAASAAQAAETAQTAQTAAEAAQKAAEDAAAAAGLDKTAAETAAKAADIAKAQAEAAMADALKAQTAAAEAQKAAEKSDSEAAESAADAAEAANSSAASAAAAAEAAASSAASAKLAAQAKKAAEDAEAAAKKAVEDAAADQAAAEEARKQAQAAEDAAAKATAEAALSEAKMDALVALNDSYTALKENATATERAALAQAVKAARENVRAADTMDALAEAVENGLAALDNAVCLAKNFSDVDLDAWYHDAIDFVLQEGIMSGNGDGTFAPEETLTRAMLVQILYNIEGRPSVETDKTFSDVEADDWYRDAVLWAAGKGVVLGYDDGTFGPEDDVTREQMVTILWRYAGQPGVTAQRIVFADSDEISDWAVDAVLWAYENKIVQGIGDDRFDPAGPTQRAAAAQVMMKYFQQ